MGRIAEKRRPLVAGLSFVSLLLWLPAAALAAGAPLLARADTAVEERVRTLLGYWFAPGRDASQARVLRITNVIFADDRSAVLAGYYGAAAIPWPEAGEITARLQDSRIAVEVLSRDGTRARLALSGEGLLRGALERSDGAREALRFSRSTLAEIQRFIAERPVPKARATRGSVIELVYVGADDCSLCRRWEAEQLAGGKLERSGEWQHIRFTEVKLVTLTARFRVEDVPERLQPRFHEMVDSGLRIQGVPSFVLLVNGMLRAHALGPGEFDAFVQHAIRAAVREKLSASRR